MWILAMLAACGGAADVGPSRGDAFVILAYAGDELVEGAKARFVAGDGTVVEGETDASGELLIAGFAWSDGPASIVIVHDGELRGGLGIDEAWLARAVSERGDLPVGFTAPDEPIDTVRVAVTARNAPADTSGFVAFHPFGVIVESGPSMSATLPAGQAFDALAFAWRRADVPLSSPYGYANVVDGVAIASSPGLDDDGAIVLDFAAGAETAAYAHTAALPASAFFDETQGYTGVFAADSGLSVPYGVPTLVDVDGGEAIFEGEYLRLDTVTQPVTLYQHEDRYGAFSSVLVSGWPDASPDLPWLTPPELATDDWAPLDEPLAWSAEAADLDDPTVAGQLYLFDDDASIGSLWVAPGEEAVWPELPDGLSPDDLFPAGAPEAALGWASEGEAAARYATAPRIPLVW